MSEIEVMDWWNSITAKVVAMLHKRHGIEDDLEQMSVSIDGCLPGFKLDEAEEQTRVQAIRNWVEMYRRNRSSDDERS
jgi:hypothetical protein